MQKTWSHWNFKKNYFIKFKQWEIYAIYKFLFGLNNLDTDSYGLFFPPLPIRALPATNASSNQARTRAWNDQGRKRLLLSKAYTATADLCSVSKDLVPRGRRVYMGYFSQRPRHCWESCTIYLPWFALRGMWLVQSCPLESAIAKQPENPIPSITHQIRAPRPHKLGISWRYCSWHPAQLVLAVNLNSQFKW